MIPVLSGREPKQFTRLRLVIFIFLRVLEIKIFRPLRKTKKIPRKAGSCFGHQAGSGGEMSNQFIEDLDKILEFWKNEMMKFKNA
jgi:hypothetical protein